MKLIEKLIGELKKGVPDKDVILVAIKKLTNPKDIVQFYKDYVEHLKETGNDNVKNNPEKTADSIIGYILAWYFWDPVIISRWRKTIKSISHPFLGR